MRDTANTVTQQSLPLRQSGYLKIAKRGGMSLNTAVLPSRLKRFVPARSRVQ